MKERHFNELKEVMSVVFVEGSDSETELNRGEGSDSRYTTRIKGKFSPDRGTMKRPKLRQTINEGSPAHR